MYSVIWNQLMEDYHMTEMFYWALVQAVLMFRLETWSMLEAITVKVEVTHVRLLRHVIGKRARRTTHSTWATPETEEVLRLSVMQTTATYIGCR